ncbi:MAG: DUF177 domain-containing protein [Bdellovibrionaceae bacterium]|nr:DUF177 domain-containing protein [Pseudobdellovibrionaceae bacterium]MBX3034316.1 DUF177 domain-containing protein [Pseudobdellovibrionaceae bacterium]
MRLRLHDIPEEGKAFLWDRQSGELNHVLADLIRDREYTAEFFIKPINSRNFELTGMIRTALPEQCSRCGIDFDFMSQTRFHEILIPEQSEDRTGRYARVNHISDAEDSGLSVAEYAIDHTFDMGEYLHEQVALTLPFNPAPAETPAGDCRLCGVMVKGRIFSYNEEMPEEKPQNPFSALKNLKI